MIHMRHKFVFLLLVGIVFVVLFSSMVYAGYLTATRTVGDTGTTFTIQWRQGFGSGTVFFQNGAVYGSRTLNLGPNSCYVAGLPGNNRAIHVNIAADATGPYTPDAVVRCDLCGCEDNPNTNFRCITTSGTTQYRCVECDACDSNPCTHSWQDCNHVDCTTRTCTCDNVRCSNQGGCASCGHASEIYECQSGDCVRTGGGCVAGSCGAQCDTGWESSNYNACVDSRWLGIARDYCGGDMTCVSGGVSTSGRSCQVFRRWIDNRNRDCYAMDCSSFPGTSGSCMESGVGVGCICQ